MSNEVKEYREKRGVEWRRPVAAVLIIAAVITAVCAVSYGLTAVRNPVAYAVGVFRITVAERETTVVQASPRVVLAKPGTPDATFRDIMEFDGYVVTASGEGTYTVEKDGEEFTVKVYGGSRFSKWVWQS